jgi:predicted protein tyrosine phosphatase
MTRQSQLSKTAGIFSTECPYNNSYQTNAPRILFVCSVGMLRSPTAQMVASARGWNARACGSSVDVALIPISCNLIDWADLIIFLNAENAIEAHAVFRPVDYDNNIKRKQIVWNVDDSYDWGDNALWRHIDLNLTLLQQQGILPPTNRDSHGFSQTD